MTDTNYRELQDVYSRLESRGFRVLAFPCNQFGAQEPGTPEEIVEFARGKYGATFPLFEKIDVNGPNTHPVYSYLKSQKEDPFPLGADIKWNFAKFLIGADGEVIGRFGPQQSPLSLEGEITTALEAAAKLELTAK